MSQVDRTALLQRLAAAGAGLPSRSAAWYVLNRGWAYTYNAEVACACPTGIDPSVRGAVDAASLVKMLRQTEEASLDITADDKSLIIRGKGKKSQLVMAWDEKLWKDIATKVDRPEEWRPVNGTFAEAVGRVVKCTSRKEEYAKACVHVHPDYVEASDNVKAARSTLPTFVTESALVRGTVLKEVIPLGFTSAGATPRWLHFKNKTGLRMSVRKYGAGDYPDLSGVFAIRGRPVVLPRGLKGAAVRAGVLADEGPEGAKVTVRLTARGTFVEGCGVLGRHEDVREAADFGGEEGVFRVPAALLAELSEGRGELEVTGRTLRLSDGPHVFVTSLEPV